jgi:hypothetical protein
VYESLDSDELDVAFGINLRKWAGEQGWKSMIRAGEEKATKQRGAVPEVLTALLSALEELYEGVNDDRAS